MPGGELAALTQELISLNRNLDEANLVKERYLGYFMNSAPSISTNWTNTAAI